MAERRMFAKTIIDSDAFLDMPATAQLLYFHLSMRADDDGFINNPKSIMRNIGCREDDASVLVAKKFILPFESGVIVIKHWRIHNYIQNDRKHETKYKEELQQLELDENKAYRRVSNENQGNLYPKCIQDVSKVDTEVRLGKDRDRIVEDKDNIVANRKRLADKVFETDSNEYKLAELLYTEHKKHDANFLTGKNVNSTLQKWAADIEKIFRIDGRTFKEIESAIKFSQFDLFWRSNILSGAKLRIKFDTLMLQSRNLKQSPQKPLPVHKQESQLEMAEQKLDESPF